MAFKTQQERVHPGLDVDLVAERGVGRADRHCPGEGGDRVGSQGSREAEVRGTYKTASQRVVQQ